MSNPYVSRILYGVAVVLSYALTSFGIQLGAGKVPISPDWEWVVPILSAVVTGLLTLLPRVGYEHVAQQTDSMVARGYRRRDLVVVTQDEAIQGIASAPPPDEGRMPPTGGSQ